MIVKWGRRDQRWLPAPKITWFTDFVRGSYQKLAKNANHGLVRVFSLILGPMQVKSVNHRDHICNLLNNIFSISLSKSKLWIWSLCFDNLFYYDPYCM